MGMKEAEAFIDGMKDIFSTLSPRGSEAINSATNVAGNVMGFLTAPMRAVGRGVQYAATRSEKDPGSMKGFIQSTVGGDGKHATDFHVGGEKLEDGSYKGGMWLNGADMAATASGLGIGYRFLSGGGVYRDKDGNTDIAGIPFV